MFKKAGPILAVTALLLGVAAPALAIFETNATLIGITNLAESVSSTGLNSQSNIAALVDSDHGSYEVGTGDRHMTTGATTSNATATVSVATDNSASVYGVDLEGTLELDEGDDLELWFNLDNLTFADTNLSQIQVANGAGASSYTGQNVQDDVLLADDVDHASVEVGTGIRTFNSGAATSTSNASVTIDAINIGQFGL